MRSLTTPKRALSCFRVCLLTVMRCFVFYVYSMRVAVVRSNTPNGTAEKPVICFQFEPATIFSAKPSDRHKQSAQAKTQSQSQPGKPNCGQRRQLLLDLSSCIARHDNRAPHHQPLTTVQHTLCAALATLSPAFSTAAGPVHGLK